MISTMVRKAGTHSLRMLLQSESISNILLPEKNFSLLPEQTEQSALDLAADIVVQQCLKLLRNPRLKSSS